METMSRASRTVTHPLDPLTPAEIETAVAIVRRERALGDDALFVSVALHEPPKDVVLRFPRGRARSSGTRSSSCATGRPGPRARRWCRSPPAPSSPGARCRACSRPSRSTSSSPASGWCARAPRGRPRCASAAWRTSSLRSWILVSGLLRRRRRSQAAPDPRAHLGPLASGRQRLRAPRRGRRHAGRHGRDGGGRGRGPRRGAAARPRGQLLARCAAGSGKCSALPGRRPPRPSVRSRSRSPRARASRCAAGRCAGRSGASASASRHARAWCCTRSPMTTAAGAVPSSTEPRWPRWSSPTAIPLRRTGARTPSTRASTASGCWPTRSRSAATAWARSATSTRSSRTPPARRPCSATPSACTRRTSASCGSTRTSARATSRSAARAGWWCRPSRPSATTSTASTGTSTRTARSSCSSSSPASSPRAPIAPGERPTHGALVAPGLYAPNHQHWFSFRLDMMVDGPRNAVYEVDSAAVPLGPENPGGNAWVVHRRLLARESEACRDADPLAGRYWMVTSAEARNALGEPTAYKLVPGENVRALAHRDSSVARRAGFMAHHLWVTRHDPSRALRGRRLSEPAPGRRRPPGVRRCRSAAGERGRRALVQPRRPPRGPPGGLAGDAGRVLGLRAQAGRVLRREPGARRPAAGRARPRPLCAR